MLCMMVWMFGLASRLQRCQATSARWAEQAGITNPEMPLQGLREEQWQVHVPAWTEMEDCVHAAASDADADIHAAWRTS